MQIFPGERPKANEKGTNALGRVVSPLGVSRYWVDTAPIAPGAGQTPTNRF
jgi:hypothetical protein